MMILHITSSSAAKLALVPSLLFTAPLIARFKCLVSHFFGVRAVGFACTAEMVSTVSGIIADVPPDCSKITRGTWQLLEENVLQEIYVMCAPGNQAKSFRAACRAWHVSTGLIWSEPSLLPRSRDPSTRCVKLTLQETLRLMFRCSCRFDALGARAPGVKRLQTDHFHAHESNTLANLNTLPKVLHLSITDASLMHHTISNILHTATTPSGSGGNQAGSTHASLCIP